MFLFWFLSGKCFCSYFFLENVFILISFQKMFLFWFLSGKCFCFDLNILFWFLSGKCFCSYFFLENVFVLISFRKMFLFLFLSGKCFCSDFFWENVFALISENLYPFCPFMLIWMTLTWTWTWWIARLTIVCHAFWIMIFSMFLCWWIIDNGNQKPQINHQGKKTGWNHFICLFQLWIFSFYIFSNVNAIN